MRIRRKTLPPGWYPETPEAVYSFIETHEKPEERVYSACVTPHAGWTYSGRIALKAIGSLKEGAETIIVIGGHLPSQIPPLICLEDAVETPLGIVSIDTEFRDALSSMNVFDEDRYSDNSVEVQLPLIAALFPAAKIVWLRFPPVIESYDLGEKIAVCAQSLKRDIRVVGSTDLTHYGPNYDFMPQGIGPAALEWVTKKNDAALLKAIQSRDPQQVLEHAEMDQSACSIGSVLGVMGYADAIGASEVTLLAYGTSADIYPSTSFVGYAALGWK